MIIIYVSVAAHYTQLFYPVKVLKLYDKSPPLSMPVPKNLLLSISCQCIMTDSSNPLTQSCLFLKTKFESVECVSNLREITLRRLLDWSDADDLSRRRESKSLNVSLCATACVRSYRVMEAADW